MTALGWRVLARSRPTVVALGNFDGVHLGHRRVLESLRAEARRLGADPVALTFEPHPRAFFFPEKKTVLLTSPREKEERIRAAGVELLTLAFDADLAGLAAEDFIRELLLQRLRGAGFFLGPGHRFGQGALGDVALLRKVLGENGPAALELEPVSLDGEIVSSSAIRHRLQAGEVEKANALLGRPYALTGQVEPGRRLGRGLGFPTANLRLEDSRKALPAFGVYGGYARVEKSVLPALANVGLRPTFNGQNPTVEVHIPGFDGDLYGRDLAFETHRFLRPERHFPSLEALKDQISSDIALWMKGRGEAAGIDYFFNVHDGESKTPSGGKE